VTDAPPIPCPVCQRPTAHERIMPVSRGQDYWRCKICSTVHHTPKVS
jgi:ribosomal protein L37AE/L43A